ncbi:aspartic peptidase A1 family [Artemisia annua]|uniref:Aspartic peptidase A1 family n=1 Tax=Artemisia annua TaxID=35608 RepID=A0A2U1ML69_ARTAN|nr:aspartic peptidase A1 family [Artemisia annua]
MQPCTIQESHPLNFQLLILMASSIFIASPILFLILFHLLLATEPVSVLSRTTETLFRANTTRASSSNASNESLVKANLKEVYTMTLAVGTPPVPITVVMDTGSDLIWIKCNSENFPSPFDASMSSSFSEVDDENCDRLGLSGCQTKYQSGMSVNVSLGRETLTTWDNKEHPGVIFGCGIPSDTNFHYDGIVGLGRGKSSLVSQLKLPFLPSISYCIPGSKVISAFPYSNVQMIPLREQGGQSYYYISLEGISVGETRLPVTNVDFANANGDGGMIIDSGTTFTFLERRIVDMIYNEFLNQTKLKRYDGDPPFNDDLQNCFNTPYNVEIIPKLIFHFEGANWELPSEYYIYEEDGVGVACLAIVANPDDEKVSIFGYRQQQSMSVTYDLQENYLVLMPRICN